MLTRFMCIYSSEQKNVCVYHLAAAMHVFCVPGDHVIGRLFQSISWLLRHTPHRNTRLESFQDFKHIVLAQCLQETSGQYEFVGMVPVMETGHEHFISIIPAIECAGSNEIVNAMLEHTVEQARRCEVKRIYYTSQSKDDAIETILQTMGFTYEHTAGCEDVTEMLLKL